MLERPKSAGWKPDGRSDAAQGFDSLSLRQCSWMGAGEAKRRALEMRWSQRCGTRVRIPAHPPHHQRLVSSADRVFGYEPKGRTFESCTRLQQPQSTGFSSPCSSLSRVWQSGRLRLAVTQVPERTRWFKSICTHQTRAGNRVTAPGPVVLTQEAGKGSSAIGAVATIGGANRGQPLTTRRRAQDERARRPDATRCDAQSGESPKPVQSGLATESSGTCGPGRVVWQRSPTSPRRARSPRPAPVFSASCVL